MCQNLHCLPRPGGLYDQDFRQVMLMGMVMSAQATKAKKDQDEMDRKSGNY